MDTLHRDDGHCFHFGCADHYSYRWCGYAGGSVYVEQLLGLGGSRHWFFAQQLDADYCGIVSRLVRCDSFLHHVRRDEPLVH